MNSIQAMPVAGSAAERAGSTDVRKVLVLVLACDKEPWRSIETHGQRTTWVANTVPGVQVFFYYGVTGGLSYWTVAATSRLLHHVGPGFRKAFLRSTGPRYGLRTREAGDRIDVAVPEIFGTIGAKTIGALRHLLKAHSFDYLFRTNNSTYVYLPLLQQFAQSLPKTRCYAGFLGQSQDLTFASGASLVLSRDLVEFAAQDDQWDWDLMDDIAMARSMLRAGVTPRPFTRLDIDSADQVPRVPADQWKTCFHVRCMCAADRSHDVEIMKRVHGAYAEAWRA